MKSFFLSFIILFLSLSSFSQDPVKLTENIPNPRITNGSWIYQEINVLQERESEMNAIIDSLEKATGIEIGIAILATIGENDPDNFANLLFSSWGIGKKEKDNGILILQVLNQRFIRIETGYGMEEKLPDLICADIISSVSVPHFKRNNFADGHYQTLKTLIKCIGDSVYKPLVPFTEAAIPNRSQVLDDEISKKEETFEASLDLYKTPYQLLLEKIVMGLYIAIGLLIVVALFFIFRNKYEKDPLKKYKNYEARPKWIAWVVFAVIASWSVYLLSVESELLLFSVPFAFIFRFSVGPLIIGLLTHSEKVASAYKNEPRICKGCGSKMSKAGEKQEDEFLDEIKEAEEEVNIKNYDVWICKCGEQRIDEYSGDNDALKCPDCKNRTYAQIKTQVLKAATYSSSGEAVNYYKCGFCKKTDEKKITLAKKVKSSSGSSGGSSFGSSSGSSFGGGSSGGGGSSSRY